MLHDSLLHDGLDAAFDLFIKLYRTEAEVPKACHGWGHILGEAAYTLYSNGEQFELRPEAAYCGYGFFHGFMETLLFSTGNISEAQNFCAEVDAKIAGRVASSGSTACYHGIGHGVTDGTDPRLWGDADTMVAPGLLLCEKVSESDFQEYLCATGVFNAIEILSTDEKY